MPLCTGNGQGPLTIDSASSQLEIGVGDRQTVGGYLSLTAASFTLEFEASWDGGQHYISVPWIKYLDNTQPVPQPAGSLGLVSVTAAFAFCIPLPGGVTHVKVSCSGFSGGSGTLKMHAVDSVPGYVAVLPGTSDQAAANFATGQVTAGVAAGTLLVATATRRYAVVQNLDDTINVFVGPATVTTANGKRLGPGESITLETTALIQVIAESGTPVVDYVEFYD